MAASDFAFADHGSVCVLAPYSPAAHEWAKECLPEDALGFGGGIAIDPRYVGPILEGIEGAGLSVGI